MKEVWELDIPQPNSFEFKVNGESITRLQLIVSDGCAALLLNGHYAIGLGVKQPNPRITPCSPTSLH